MNTRLNEAWDYVFTKLFHEGTQLIYDCRFSLAGNGNISGLPSLEEIKAQIPSPCAWNTGMENSAISAGVMLATIANRFTATGDKSLHSYAEKILNGVKLLTSVSGVRGFLARSVSPLDGKSFYLESSRDQYTHLVYGACRYLECGLCTQSERAFLTDVLVGFAEYAHRCVTKENDYQILRADGGDTMVCRMLFSAHHEWTRLPMIYVAAWKASGDERWLNAYAEICDVCIEGSKGVKTKYWEKPFCLAQMQDSLRILYDYEPDETYKARYVQLMELVAGWTENEKSAEIVKEAKRSARLFDALMPDWRKSPMTYLAHWGAPRGNYGYYMPDRSQAYERDLWDIHYVANQVTIAERCPSTNASAENVRALTELFSLVSFERHATESPIFMLEAYWEVKANEKRR